jgi:hypothetical protein
MLANLTPARGATTSLLISINLNRSVKVRYSFVILSEAKNDIFNNQATPNSEVVVLAT